MGVQGRSLPYPGWEAVVSRMVKGITLVPEDVVALICCQKADTSGSQYRSIRYSGTVPSRSAVQQTTGLIAASFAVRRRRLNGALRSRKPRYPGCEERRSVVSRRHCLLGEVVALICCRDADTSGSQDRGLRYPGIIQRRPVARDCLDLMLHFIQSFVMNRLSAVENLKSESPVFAKGGRKTRHPCKPLGNQI